MSHKYTKFYVHMEVEMIHDGSVSAQDLDLFLEDPDTIEEGLKEGWIRLTVRNGRTMREQDVAEGTEIFDMELTDG
jgi:hypothetical protein